MAGKRQYKRKKGTSISKAKKRMVNGIEYKSGLEAYAAEKFAEAQLFFQYEPTKFVLQESFYMNEDLYERQANGKGEFKKRGGKKVLPLTYQPDFIGGNFICETKGWAGEAFPIRWKLFKKIITDNYDGELLIFKPQSRKDVDDMIKIILSKEVWKDVENHEGCYKVSNYGRVLSVSRKISNIKNVSRILPDKILVPFYTGKDKYPTVDLKGDVQKNNKIHLLVANAFIENNDSTLDTVNHIDENVQNNNVSNLERLSRADNVKYSHSKPVMQFDMEGNFIREYPSTSSVKQYGFSQSCVSACASGKLKSTKGSVWKYK